MANEDALGEAERMGESFEGFRSAPYQDSVGVWTIGFGSTRDINNSPITQWTPSVTIDEARRLALRDMRRAMMGVEGDVKVPLSTDEEAALIDFSYNLGLGALGSSTLLRNLNAGDYAGAAAQFDLWDHAGGKVLAGLLRRREAEKSLFDTASAAAPPPAAAPAPPAPATATVAAPPAADAPPGGFVASLGRFLGSLFG